MIRAPDASRSALASFLSELVSNLRVWRIFWTVNRYDPGQTLSAVCYSNFVEPLPEISMSNAPGYQREATETKDSTLPGINMGSKGSPLVGINRRETEPDRQETDHRRDDFLAILAHELRNPLEPILNAVEILKTKGPPDRELLESLAIIVRQVQQMGRLLDDLMDVARLTHDKLALRLEKTELATVVQAARESCAPLMKRRHHHLTVEIPSHSILLAADRARIVQVFGSLLNNAASFTNPGGNILLKAELIRPASPGEQTTVVVRVKDNGRGIPAEMLSEIFEMFVQEDRSMERSHGGLGLGLTLAKRLAEMHGGSIEAKSEGRGLGSEFVVRLPVLAVQATADSAAQAIGPLPGARRRSRRVLVVEDNLDSAQSLSLLLQMRRNNVLTALDGIEGVEAAAAFQPDLILLDIGLPKLNGYEAAKRIRQERGDSRLVIVALTGWGKEEDKLKSRDAGINLHLVKPVDPDLLDELLDSAPVLD